MGMRTVYIRKEYEDVFDGLPNKAAFFAWALEQARKKQQATEPRYTSVEPTA